MTKADQIERLRALVEDLESSTKLARELLSRLAHIPCAVECSANLTKVGDSIAITGASIVDTLAGHDYTSTPRGAKTSKVRRALGYGVQS